MAKEWGWENITEKQRQYKHHAGRERQVFANMRTKSLEGKVLEQSDFSVLNWLGQEGGGSENCCKMRPAQTEEEKEEPGKESCALPHNTVMV